MRLLQGWTDVHRGLPGPQKITKACLRASHRHDPMYAFNCITVPNRFKGSDWLGACSLSSSYNIWTLPGSHNGLELPNRCNNEICGAELIRLGTTLSGSLKAKQSCLGDMTLLLHDVINTLLGADARAEWEKQCLEIEIRRLDTSLRVLAA